jgi:hypothetical protein
MQIVNAYPPNIDKIDAAIGPRSGRPGVFYAYGQSIFNPDDVQIPPWIVAHEAVHAWRQLNPVFVAPNPEIVAKYAAMSTFEKVEAWWDAYLADEEFRFAEELVAHAAEYRYFCSVKTHDRALRRRYLHAIAERLVGPLYGAKLRVERAKEQIKKVAKESFRNG